MSRHSSDQSDSDGSSSDPSVTDDISLLYEVYSADKVYPPILPFFSCMTTAFSKFRTGNQFADVEIICSDGSVFSHKMVLSKNSKFIANCFSSSFQSVDVILCPDLSIDQMSNALDLLYTGQTKVSDRKSISEIKKNFKFLGMKMNIEVKEVNPVPSSPAAYIKFEMILPAPIVVETMAPHSAANAENLVLPLTEKMAPADIVETVALPPAAIVKTVAPGPAAIAKNVALPPTAIVETETAAPGPAAIAENVALPQVGIVETVALPSAAIGETETVALPLAGNVEAVALPPAHMGETAAPPSANVFEPEASTSADVPNDNNQGRKRKKPNPEETPSRVSAKRRTCDRCSLGVRETVYDAHLLKCKVDPAFQRANKPKVEVPGTLSCNGKPYNYRCHLCRGLFHTYTPLLRHLAMYHFRKSLQEWQPGTNKCQYCTKEFDVEHCLYDHQAVDHRVLAGQIPSKKKLEIVRKPPKVSAPPE